MAQSFTAAQAAGVLTETGGSPEGGAVAGAQVRRRVLVTGAAGRIGSYFAEHWREKYDLRLMVRGDEDPARIERLRAWGEVVTGDLGDLDALKGFCDGIDTVIHLAANPGPSATWAELLPANIVGTYHLFAAAKAQKCRRVIFASSIHAVSGYPVDSQVKTSEPVNPGDLYGVSKCFGEALGRYMAEQEGLSCVAIRIGAFQSQDAARQEWSYGMMDAYVSDRDLQQLFEKAIDAENLRFAVFHGLSGNRFNRLDISDARELLGYTPQDDLTAENPHLRDLRLSEKVVTHRVGGGQKSGLRDDV